MGFDYERNRFRPPKVTKYFVLLCLQLEPGFPKDELHRRLTGVLNHEVESDLAIAYDRLDDVG